MKKSRFDTARKWLIFWTIFVGLGAVWGALCMLIDPSGKLLQMDTMLPYFKKLPFADVLFVDYTFSGIALLIVNGITNLTAAVLLIRNKKPGVVLGGVFGITLMLWICIQFYMFPSNPLSRAYFIFGLCQALTGYAAWVFEKQEAFAVNAADYSNIGTNPRRLVVGRGFCAVFDRGYFTGAAVLRDMDCLLAQKYSFPGTGAFHSSIGTVPVQRHYVPLRAADPFGTAVCTGTYSDFL